MTKPSIDTTQFSEDVLRLNPELRGSAVNSPTPKPEKTNGNKFGAIRTWSELCQRTFDSKAEARRGDDLMLSLKAGEISCLEFQPKFSLSKEPRITYTADFKYIAYEGYTVYEDVKGVLSRDCRTKLAWVKEKYGVEVKLWKW